MGKDNYAAKLRNRVVLQSLAETSDTAGGFVSSWQAVATLWAQVTPVAERGIIGGGEQQQAMQQQANQWFRITLRYRTGVTAAMRIVMGSRVFNIRRVTNKDEQNKVLELMVEEGVAV